MPITLVTGLFNKVGSIW